LRRPTAENNARGNNAVREHFVLPKLPRSFSRITEMSMEWAFLRCRTALRVRIVIARATLLTMRMQAKWRSTRRLPCGEKNCEPKTVSGRSTGSLLPQNARISGQPIRKNRRGGRLPRLFHTLRARVAF
jgi:hypothetical protein